MQTSSCLPPILPSGARSASFSIRCGIRPTQAKLFRSWIFRLAPSESGVVFQTV